MSSPSSPLIISGNEVALAIRTGLKAQVKELLDAPISPFLPCLAVILVGERKDSETYVRMKTKACEEIGIGAVQHTLPASTSQKELLALVKELNEDQKVHGILLQLPLPAHLDSQEIIGQIKPEKDVDALSPTNQGMLMKDGDKAPLICCTPAGCLALLDHYSIPISGKRAVVIGRSILVGKPIALLLLARNATVTIAHSKTEDLASLVKQADIVVAAIGQPRFVKGEWIKEGAVVLDVGINPIEDKTKKQGFRLVGDVDYESAKLKASAITPVPGGVGPMTVAILMRNTLVSYKLLSKKK